MKKLFVASLSYTTTSEELQILFSQFGKVDSANIILDKVTGKSRGFGFVEMSSDEEAKQAIQGISGQMFQGRKLFVNEAKPKER